MTIHSRPVSQVFICFLFYLLVGSSNCYSQTPNLAWAKIAGGVDTDISRVMTIDASGNSYITGDFQGTADFDPGPGVYNLTTAQIVGAFVLKLDPSGNFLWAKQFAGTNFSRGYSITVNSSGEVYAAGVFTGTCDMDPGPGIYNLYSSFFSAYIAKLDASGNFIWAQQMQTNEPYSLALDSNEDLYITGSFEGTVDFDPGPGVFNLTGDYDIYIAKLHPSGAFVWVKSLTGVNPNADWNEGYTLTIDGSNNLYLIGRFYHTIDFDPGPGVYNLSVTGACCCFVLKLDVNGNFVYAKQVADGAGQSTGMSIAVGADGHVCISGYFNGQADFDPGPGVFTMNYPANSECGFFVQLDNAGNFIWAKKIDQASGTVVPNSIAIDAADNMYAGGFFGGTTADFDPGPGTFNMNSAYWDGFVVKLDNAGNFIWARQIGDAGSGSDQICNSLKLDASGNIFLGGTCTIGTADLDPCPSVFPLTPSGNEDIFIAKWVQNTSINSTVSIMASAVSTCPGGSITFTANPVNGGASPVYQWSVNNVSVGTNSAVYTSNSLADGDQVRLRMIPVTACGPGSPVFSNTITVTVTGAVVINVQPVSIATCEGGSVSFFASISNAQALQWQVSTDGGSNYSNVTAAISSTLTLSSVTATMNGYLYRLVISDCTGPVSVTIPAMLTVTAAASISSQPAAITLCEGSDAVFNVTATGSSYQWQVSTDGGSNYSNINTAISTTLTISSVTSAMNGYLYRLIISDCTGPTLLTIPATLTVKAAPSISLQPAAVIICEGSDALFTVTATGISYQWQVSTNSGVSFTDIAGETNTSLQLPVVTAVMNNNQYRLIIMGESPCTQIISNGAQLIVKANPIVILSASPYIVLTEGQTTTLTATAGSQINTFEWFHNNVLIPAVTGNMMTINYGNAGEYYVIAQSVNGCSNNSNRINITDTAEPFTFITPNPNDGLFIVRFPNQENNATRYITIWDSKGSRVYSNVFLVDGRDGKININTKQLSSGVYVLMLSDKNKKRLKTGKLVVR